MPVMFFAIGAVCSCEAPSHAMEGLRDAGALVDECSLDHRQTFSGDLRSFVHAFPLGRWFAAEVWGLITFVTNFIPNLGHGSRVVDMA